MSSSVDIILLHLFFFICTFLNFHFHKSIFIFCVQFKGDIVCILHMFSMGPLIKKKKKKFHEWQLTETTKATKISEMWTQDAEKTDLVRTDVSGHLCFALVLFREETLQYLCFSLSIKWISLWTCSTVKSSARLPEHQIGRAASLQSTRQQKVLFHCLKNICVCLKHTLCLWKGLSFPFWGADLFDHVNFQWFLIITCA